MEKPSDSLNKAEHPATQPGCLSPNECGRDTSLSSAGRQAPGRRESPVPGKPPQTSGCWLRLRPHAASTPLLGGCLPPPSCTCGQKGLWRRLVDICAHSTAPGFPLGLASSTWAALALGNMLLREEASCGDLASWALPRGFLPSPSPSPSQRGPEP